MTDGFTELDFEVYSENKENKVKSMINPHKQTLFAKTNVVDEWCKKKAEKPKFDIGDAINFNGSTYFITGIEDGQYSIGNGKYPIDVIDKSATLRGKRKKSRNKKRKKSRKGKTRKNRRKSNRRR